MRLVRRGGIGEQLAVVLDDGTEHLVERARLHELWVSAPGGYGDRATWTEAYLIAGTDTLYVRVVDVIDHHAGVSRDSGAIFASVDGGRTWTRSAQTISELSGLPVLAMLTTNEAVP